MDDLIDRFGFREIKVQGKEILLNEKKFRIKGVCRHEDHPDYGSVLNNLAGLYRLMGQLEKAEQALERQRTQANAERLGIQFVPADDERSA